MAREDITFANDNDRFSDPTIQLAQSTERIGNGHLGTAVKDKFTDFVEGVKERIPQERLRRVGNAARQAKDYVEDRGAQGLIEDAGEVIRRHPIPALLLGVVVGVLLARRQGD